MLPLSPSENEREQINGIRKTVSQGLVCLILVDELGFFLNMFRFAVAFLEYSENLHLIRGGGKKRADARKRYTAMVPRHKGVHMNTR